MKRYRIAAGAGGVLALGAALALGGDPAGGAVEAMVTALGNDYLVVATFAGVGLLVAASVLMTGRSDTLRQTETPTPERPVTAPTAGDDVDETLASRAALLPVVGETRREDLRERLRTAAVGTWVRRGECSREEARERLDEGTWTDDGEAAAFLADRGPGVESRVLALLRGEPWSRRGARRAVAAIAEQEEREESEEREEREESEEREEKEERGETATVERGAER